MAVVGLVCDLADPRAQRMPDQVDATAIVEGVTLPRLPLPAGVDPLPIVAAMLESRRYSF